MDYSIGKIAKETGSNVQTVRYYEKLGLMPEPWRNQAGQRRYGSNDLKRLAFIRHARSLGFSLPQIKELLSLADQPEKPCATADAIVAENLSKIRDRIHALQQLEQELKRIQACDMGNTSGSCRVIETLANHQLCLHDHHQSIEGKSFV